MENLEDRIEEIIVDLSSEFFSTGLYGPHVLARAYLLAKAAIKAGMDLEKKINGHP
jgi:hypothetical protein